MELVAGVVGINLKANSGINLPPTPTSPGTVDVADDHPGWAHPRSGSAADGVR